MMIYIIIAAVIILLIYIALKRDAQIKEPKRLASKNQYIDTAGHTREWPVGSFTMQGRGLRPLHNFYNSTPIERLLELEQQGYSFMFFNPDTELPPSMQRVVIAFYQKDGVYTGIYSEEDVEKLDKTGIKYIRLINKK
ncbi:hypothetical protein [Hoylesella timonensis]|uniref:hypothetical protein n=1 Tax=Hoylesella timonensis TaxID=386414 RepID=UPI002889EEC3|nr:hypothetical protein [Hoylesella timonensis]